MVRLQPLAPHHAAALQPLLEDPAIAETTPFPHPYPAGGAEAYVKESMALWEAGTKYVFAICDGHDQAIGMSLLKDVDREHRRGELGYWVGKPYWGKGHATQAARDTVTYGFDVLGLDTIQAVTIDSNLASLGVLKRLGFVETGRSTWSLPKWSEPRPTVALMLSASAWRTGHR